MTLKDYPLQLVELYDIIAEKESVTKKEEIWEVVFAFEQKEKQFE